MPTKVNLDISRTEYLLIGLVVTVVAVYVCYFTDWFRNKPIRIEYTTRAAGMPRAGRGAEAEDPAKYGVMFSLGGDYKLTSVKVVAADEWALNPKTPAVWHLVADKPVTPVQGFVYGVPISGMKPYLAGVEAQPLQPGMTYHVLVEAGKQKGERDFIVSGSGAARR